VVKDWGVHHRAPAVNRVETRSGSGCWRAAGGPLPESGEDVGGIGFETRAEAFGSELLGDGDRAGCGIERILCRLRGVGLDLVLAQSGERRLGFCGRALEDRGALDAASPRDPDRLRGSGNPPSAFEPREPHLLLRDMALQLGDLGGEERAGGR
jgi:hypothetical protein